MYKSYINYDEYINLGGNLLQSEDANLYLKKASRIVDSLTFNRINQLGGFDKLSDFRKEIIKECIKNIADFYFENEDILDNILSGYSINGVSMNFNANWNVKIINGVAVSSTDYELLSQTGLTTLSFRF